MKKLEMEMSSGVPYYERDLLNIIRHGRGVPAVPLVFSRNCSLTKHSPDHNLNKLFPHNSPKKDGN